MTTLRQRGACKVVGWLGCSGPLCLLFLWPKATMPMAERVFQGAIEHVDPYVQELLDRVPVPPHLFLLPHSFGNHLVDGGFGKSGRDSQPRTIPLAVVGERIRVRFEVAKGVEQRISQLSQRGTVFQAFRVGPLPQTYQADETSLRTSMPEAPFDAFELSQSMTANGSLPQTVYTLCQLLQILEPHTDMEPIEYG